MATPDDAADDRDAADIGDSPNPVEAVAPLVLQWFGAHGRDLPWRHTRDPFAILVAELMLQQTQVSRVIDRWPQFLRRFPTVAACAAVPVGDVIDEWSGLGYNRRAVYLHQAASAVVDQHGGAMPRSLAALLALPGVGPYTARAIMAFAHEADEAVVDTNVGRIFARFTGSKLSPRLAQQLADGAVPIGHGWAWNQALLDLGASVCTSRQPSCGSCPIVDRCAWQSNGPDPAVGSAGVSSGQSRFEGSDRQGRGRLVRQLRVAPVAHDTVAVAAGWPDDPVRAEAMASSLLADGLIELRDGWLVLAGWA